MERLLAEICQEATKESEIQAQCTALLDHLATDDGKQDCYNQSANLHSILSIFRLCVRNDTSHKLNALSIDLVRVYLRKVNEFATDEVKVETIAIILKTSRDMLTETSVATTLELLTIIVELVATFSVHLTTNHVVEIIEMCHGQIKSYVMTQSRGGAGGGPSSGGAALRMKNALFQNVSSSFSATFSSSTPKVSIEDKVLSAIYLTASQVCHHFTKHRIVAGSVGGGGGGGRSRRSTTTTTATTTTSVSSSSGVAMTTQSESTTGRVTTDLIYLLLYLSKKLECKLGFFRDFRHYQEESTVHSGGAHQHHKHTSSNSSDEQQQQQQQTKGELLLLMKIYNCFYLKCLQYTLLTVPDAWRYMTTHIMEVVCKHLVPTLVDILTPLSTIIVSGLANGINSKGGNNFSLRQVFPGGSRNAGSCLPPDLATGFGRGCEKLHFGSPASTNKDFLYNTLNYQERQYIYKISLELLRLFGLENSMRPLLEALFHRIFLLSPLDQRLDSLIYMQEILKNPLLVLILSSNPLCLFGASSSHSQNLDLFKIFFDAIKESSQSEDTVMVQLSSLCLVTLLNTLESLSAGGAVVAGESSGGGITGSNTGNTEQPETNTIFSEGSKNSCPPNSTIWRSPTVKMILAYAANHRSLYENSAPPQPPLRCPPKPYSGSHSARPVIGNPASHLYRQTAAATRQQNSTINNLKSRICGYDAKAFENRSTGQHLTESSEPPTTETNVATKVSQESQELLESPPKSPLKTAESTEAPSKTADSESGSGESSNPEPNPKYLQENFNYQDRLKALIKHKQNSTNTSAKVSSTTTESQKSTEGKPIYKNQKAKVEDFELSTQAIATRHSTSRISRVPSKSVKLSSNIDQTSNKNRSQSLHLSLEHISRLFSTNQEMITLASLKTTNSDSRLALTKEPMLLQTFVERQQNNQQQLSLDIDDSVFEDVVDVSGGNEGKSSFFTPSEDDDYLSSDLVIATDEEEEEVDTTTDDIGSPSSTKYRHHRVFPGSRSTRFQNSMFGRLHSGSVEADSDATLRHFERALAHIFLRKLRALLPELVGCRNLMLVDERIQAFASGYCKDLFRNLKLLNQARADSGSAQSVSNIEHLVVALGDLLQPEIDILRRYAHLVDCLFINADGIYLATYSALLLTMKLIYLGYYSQAQNMHDNEQVRNLVDKENTGTTSTATARLADEMALPLTEAQFIDEIFNYNTTIYLSPHFLAEIYQSILVENFFSFLMVKNEGVANTSIGSVNISATTTTTSIMTLSFEKIPLVKLLHDIDVLDPSKPNAFKLSDYARLEQMVCRSGNDGNTDGSTLKVGGNALLKDRAPVNIIIRRLLLHFWDTFSSCLRLGLKVRFTYQAVVQMLEPVNGGFISSVATLLGCEGGNASGNGANAISAKSGTLSLLKSNVAYLKMMIMLLNTSVTVSAFTRLDDLYGLFVEHITLFAYQPEKGGRKGSQYPRYQQQQDIKMGRGMMRKSITTPDLASDSVVSTTAATATSTLGSGNTSASNLERTTLVLSIGQIMAMKTLLNRSSQIANHCPRVWRHVFDLCRFVNELENTIFRSTHSSLLSRARISIGTILRSNSIHMQLGSSSSVAAGTLPSSASSTTINYQHNHDLSQLDHYQSSLYHYHGSSSSSSLSASSQLISSFSTLPGICEVESSNVESAFDALLEALKSKPPPSSAGSTNTGLDTELKSRELEQVMEYLSWFVGQIFESVALKFNLSLLTAFVRALCEYSKVQLSGIKIKGQQHSQQQPGSVSEQQRPLSLSTSTLETPGDLKSLMLSRLVEVMLRFVRNGRPLLHFMRIWPIAAGHLVEASMHHELAISKKAITSMHDIINAVLSAYSEPNFFNCNESLFKCYERLLLGELVDSDCQQELLLNSICEFVEGAGGEIRSGWRSIFKALRGSKIELVTVVQSSGGGHKIGHCQTTTTLTAAAAHQVQILIDTFEAFLRTENMHVFAYASVDFILCIFHLTRRVSMLPVGIAASGFSSSGGGRLSPQSSTTMTSTSLEETFIVFLKYVQKFCKILRSIAAESGHSGSGAFIIAPYVRAKKLKLIEVDVIQQAVKKVVATNGAAFIDPKVIAGHHQSLSAKTTTTTTSSSKQCLFTNNLQSVLEETANKAAIASSLQPHQQSALLQLWSLVFDEFAATIYVGSLQYRPMLLEVYFTLLHTAASDLSPNGSLDFVLAILNHTVLPLMQNLLRETLLESSVAPGKGDGGDDGEEDEKVGKRRAERASSLGAASKEDIEEQYMFLKSWLEVFNSHIIRYTLAHFDRLSAMEADDEQASERGVKSGTGAEYTEKQATKWSSLGLLLRQTMLVYIECISGPYHDLISILGLSLLRQVLLSLNRLLNTYFWDIVRDCFQIGHQLTLAPLHQLIGAFHGLSTADDLGRIKVMTTRNAHSSSEYIRKRARQVFFVSPEGGGGGLTVSSSVHFNNARDVKVCSDGQFAADNRDYTIIIETAAGIKKSLSYNQLISQLHNHLVLVQILASVLTFNLKPKLSSLMGACFMHEDFAEMVTADGSLTTFRPVLQLTLPQYRDISAALKLTFCVAMEFDRRPGLKFLLQHICQTNISANLYQLSALAWCVQFVVDFALSNSAQHRNEECLASMSELFKEIELVYGEKLNKKCLEAGNTEKRVKSGGRSRNHHQRLSTSEEVLPQRSFDVLLRPVEQSTSPGSSQGNTELSAKLDYERRHSKCNPFDEESDYNSGTFQLVSSTSFNHHLNDYRRVKERQSIAQWTQQQQSQPTGTTSKRGSDPAVLLKSAFSVGNGKGSNSFNTSTQSVFSAAATDAHQSAEESGAEASALQLGAAITVDAGLSAETARFLARDCAIAVSAWSSILGSVIELHARSQADSFLYMLPAFRRLARPLMRTIGEDQPVLRAALIEWVDRLAALLQAATEDSTAGTFDER